MTSPPQQQQLQQQQQQQQQIVVVGGTCSPMDAAAHLKLLGESLSIIGARLHEHQVGHTIMHGIKILKWPVSTLLAATNSTSTLWLC